jgi:hypothetical protein
LSDDLALLVSISLEERLQGRMTLQVSSTEDWLHWLVVIIVLLILINNSIDYLRFVTNSPKSILAWVGVGWFLKVAKDFPGC